MTAPTAIANFLGIPIEGDITKPGRQVDQRPLAELEPLIRAVIEDDGIASIGWTQYTPYFNDGEPCTFSAGSPWVRTTGDPVAGSLRNYDDEDDLDDDEEEADDHFTVDVYGPHPSLGHRGYDWQGRERVFRDYEGPDEARYDRCLALADAIESGAFDNVLLETFGDHATVTITRDRIVVDVYSHD